MATVFHGKHFAGSLHAFQMPGYPFSQAEIDQATENEQKRVNSDRCSAMSEPREVTHALLHSNANI